VGSARGMPSMTPTELVYLKICQRKFWLFRHGVRPEFESEAVQIGKVISSTALSKKKHELPLHGFGVIDAAVLKNGEIQEIKKSSRRADLDRLQVAAYLEWLVDRGVPVHCAQIHYPKEKKKTMVTLTDEMRAELAFVRKIGRETAALSRPPAAVKITACKGCAYQEYCWD
jgi:CRISPR-associated exonuclease Cas4